MLSEKDEPLTHQKLDIDTCDIAFMNSIHNHTRSHAVTNTYYFDFIRSGFDFITKLVEVGIKPDEIIT